MNGKDHFQWEDSSSPVTIDQRVIARTQTEWSEMGPVSKQLPSLGSFRSSHDIPIINGSKVDAGSQVLVLLALTSQHLQIHHPQAQGMTSAGSVSAHGL